MGCGQNGLWSGNEPMYELHPPHTLLIVGWDSVHGFQVNTYTLINKRACLIVFTVGRGVERMDER